jgi:predicted dehydrogenase
MFASKAFSRRRFLHSLGAAAGMLALPSAVSASGPGAGGRSAANERITVGCIGVGNQGRQVMRNFLADSRAQVVAVCDVKQRELDYARQFVDRHYRTSGCRAYADFRELIARDDIDAVLIATPDHWHVLCALAAARAGKDIYLEKPMGLSREEDQALGRAAGQYGTVFQFGTQQRSDPKFRLACELARNGRIGQLKSVHVWSPVSGSGGSTAPATVLKHYCDGIQYALGDLPADSTPR